MSEYINMITVYSFSYVLVIHHHQLQLDNSISFMIILVNDDPEYHWIDKIRTPRASNEARQRLFSKLSGEVKRKIGMKVLDAGGNAVIGYKQLFDLEGETGIIVRAIGTAVTLVRDSECITNSNVHFGQDASIQDILPDGLNLPPWRSQRSLEGTITDWRCHSSPGFDGDNNKVFLTYFKKNIAYEIIRSENYLNKLSIYKSD